MSASAKEKLREVVLWLERVFDGDTIPEFEVTEQSIEWLLDLARNNAKQDRDAQILIEDANQRTQEYDAEGIRVEELLEDVGLEVTSLSRSGGTSVNVLSELADILDLQSPSQTNFLLGLQHITEKCSHLELKVIETEIAVFERQEAMAKQRLRSQRIKQMMLNLDHEASLQTSLAADRLARTDFLKQKTHGYTRQIRQLEHDIQASGYEDGLSHSAIVRIAKEYNELITAAAALRERIQKFKNLPPDLSLAGIKLEEARRLNAQLTLQINKHTDLSGS